MITWVAVTFGAPAAPAPPVPPIAPVAPVAPVAPPPPVAPTPPMVGGTTADPLLARAQAALAPAVDVPGVTWAQAVRAPCGPLGALPRPAGGRWLLWSADPAPPRGGAALTPVSVADGAAWLVTPGTWGPAVTSCADAALILVMSPAWR